MSTMKPGPFLHASAFGVGSFAVIVMEKTRLEIGFCQVFPDQCWRIWNIHLAFNPGFLCVNKFSVSGSICLPHWMKIMHAHRYFTKVVICLGMRNNFLTVLKQIQALGSDIAKE